MAGPKSILKQSPPTKTTSPAQADSTRYTQRHRQIAVHHATIIQQQKDVEGQILENLEELIDFPLGGGANASRPSSTDAARFLFLVAPFQTADYDALIEERNADERCGYVFCPRARPARSQSRAYSVIFNSSRGRDLEVVSSDKAIMFCGADCAKRAMFIKVQLSEVPAWERGGPGKAIKLMREDDELELERKMHHISLSATRDEDLQDAMKELALERGESRNSANPALVMNAEVKEK
ncbi:MAG: hypothetical protein M1828_006253 [Chrysothrix sp. TS-e1954]|nr:MAG: hypothetical protein M1828_006253 [Chrysothrix sp. TS-e1954]